jgi:predicted ATPase
LAAPDLLAASTLGQLAAHPRVSAFRRFITGWYLSYVSADDSRGIPEAGPAERLSKTGDNLPNVMQYLAEQHEERLAEIISVLASRIPQLEQVRTRPLDDGRLLLQLKDAAFGEPVPARWISDGTLKMLAYLVVLYDPEPPTLIGIEEPENHLHPRLLLELAEECRAAAERSQVFVSTHSPYLVNGIRPEELRILYRGDDGYTRSLRASDKELVRAQVGAGALLGDLWMEGYFDAGDPVVAQDR